jgi:tRNA-dihydrouridine synthase C
VPAHLPVSAKMRLGFNDSSLMRECAQAMAQGGACEIVVHARTKLDGYRPPAYWELIPAIREAVDVPVIANGEIWTVEDALRCRAQSGCDDLMLGRGSVADPGLALAIRAAVEGVDAAAAPVEVRWAQLLPQIARFWEMVCEDLEPRQRAGRLKQWLNLLRRRHPEAELAFQEVRVQTDQREITLWVQELPKRWG